MGYRIKILRGICRACEQSNFSLDRQIDNWEAYHDGARTVALASDPAESLGAPSAVSSGTIRRS